MKKFLLSLAVVATLGASAQGDLSVSITSPGNGSSITAGTAFDFNGTVTNNGTMAHNGFAGGDTIVYAPLFNGSFLGTSGGGVVAWYMTDMIGAGGNASFSQSLNIQGGSSGPIEICAYIEAFGTSYTGFIQDTSANCANVTYDNGMAIGEIRLKETFDNSFFSNGKYIVQVSSRINLINPSIEIVDINGRVVFLTDLTANGGEIRDELDLNTLANGMYIVRLRTEQGLISINKIMK